MANDYFAAWYTYLYDSQDRIYPAFYHYKRNQTVCGKDPDAEGEVSQFGALTTALAATIGTGNIVGVGTAIALGGPGAVLWCWLNSESDRCTGIIGTDGKRYEEIYS